MTQSLAEVLGIAPGNDKPNAYELLGLAAGESDPQRIEAAIEGAVERLKRSQSETDAAVWKQAAAAVTKARKLLIDPQLKSAYDAKLQKRSRASSSAKRVRGEAAQDPLRGLLPAMDPLAPFDVDAAAQRASQARPYEPPPLPPPSEQDLVNPPPAVDQPPAGNGPPVVSGPPVVGPEISLVLDDEPAVASATGPVVAASPARTRPAKRRRRRSSPLLMIGFGLLMVMMLGGVGYGVYTLVQREQQRGDVVAQAAPNPRTAAPPAARPASRPADPVMGNAGPGGSGSSSDPRSLPPLTSNVDVPLPPPLDTSGTQPGDDGMVPMTDNGFAKPPPPTVTDPPRMDPDPPQPMQPEPAKPSAAELQAGQTAIAAAEAAIKTQGWTEMKKLAEKAQAAAADEAQKQTADQLFEVADLADYYYLGVVKAMEELPSGNTFMLTAGAEVAVVESSAQQIVLQVQGRPKTFPFNDMPFVLVHKLGSFTMTGEDPMVVAAKAVFQTLAKKALPMDRKQASEWLNDLPEEVNGSHPHQIASTLARLFPGSP